MENRDGSERRYTLSNFAANLGRNVGDQLAGLGPELDTGQAQPIELEKVTTRMTTHGDHG